jgi:hypothetical protein
MRSVYFLLLLCMGWCFSASAETTPEPVRRHVLAVYDAVLDGSPAYTRAHKLFEMPLNHLGYVVDYTNIHDPLPENLGKYAAILVALNDNTVKRVRAMTWLNWLRDAQKKGLKIILLGDLGPTDDTELNPEIKALKNKVMNGIGVYLNDGWANVTYDAKITHLDARIMNFERRLGGVFPQYPIVTAVGAGKSHLRVTSGKQDEGQSDLVVTHPMGGYAAAGYMVYEHVVGDEVKYNQWYLNPFLFLSDIMGADSIPKADINTLFGRRVFYSHIDGDGWNNYAEFRQADDRIKIAAEMFRDEIIKKYPQLLFTVSVIAQEVSPACYGLPFSEEVARDIFALPNVEPASHTLSHPLYWGFFADYTEEKEKPYLPLYPQKSSSQFFVTKLITDEKKFEVNRKRLSKPDSSVNPHRGIISPYIKAEEVMKEYKTPRSFACEAFDLGSEVGGSIDYAESLASGKKVKLYQWSGDTRPFEAALKEVRLNGVFNLNGGGTRYDVEAPSYTLVAPVGVQVGEERQIYSSNTNENDYTNLWTDRFFGFHYLKSTVENTETPIRVHPFNIYFHSYSAQKKASLNALLDNFRYAEKQKLFPVYASHYAAMANDFYQIRYLKLGKDQWQIRNRGNIQTIRFDKSALKAVDINQSKGVLGYSYLHGSLYVSLDKSVNKPVILLTNKDTLAAYPPTKRPYLIESNIEIKNLKYIKNRLTFIAQGRGESVMRWKQPSRQNYLVRIKHGKEIIYSAKHQTNGEGILDFNKALPVGNLLFIITPDNS